jgi:hypothetical protein
LLAETKLKREAARPRLVDVKPDGSIEELDIEVRTSVDL